jgi:hypothetical protein
MEEINPGLNNTSSNSNEALALNPTIFSSSNSSSTSSYQELVLRKLTLIFRSKANDSIKQLEDLWEHVNQNSSNNNNNNKSKSISPVLINVNNESAGVKRDLSKVVGCNPSSNLSSGQLAKKPKLLSPPLPPQSKSTANNGNNESTVIVFSSLNSPTSESTQSIDLNSVVDMFDICCVACK